MKRSDVERLRDARDFAHYAQDDAGGLPAEILAQARQPQHAALYDLAVVGETLNKVSAEVRSTAPEIPWQAISDLRNFIVHAYWQVDLEIIADVIKTRIDPLLEQLDQLIAIVERTQR
jgi:uncharacterized protein with HEPN domain